MSPTTTCSAPRASSDGTCSGRRTSARTGRIPGGQRLDDRPARLACCTGDKNHATDPLSREGKASPVPLRHN